MIKEFRHYPPGTSEHAALDELHEIRRRLDRGTAELVRARERMLDDMEKHVR